jgi:chitinase
VNDYGLLRRSEAPVYYDSASGGSWSYDGTTFWGFDDPTSIAEKTAYVQRIGLGGVMFWELAGDTRDGELTRAIAEGLFGTP